VSLDNTSTHPGPAGLRAGAAADDAPRDAGAIRRPGPLAADVATALVLWRRDLVRFFRQPSRLAGALGQPVIFWFVIGAGMSGTFRMPGTGTGYLAYFYPGVVLMVVLFASIFTTLSVIEDRHRGFLQTVLAGPGSRAALVVGKTLGSASVALSQAALFLLLAPAAGYPWRSVSWPLLLVALALAAIGLAALGFAVAWIVDNVQGYHAVQMTLLVPLWVVSGAMFPMPADRPGFATVMRWNPVSYAVSAARRALGGPDAPGALPGSAGRDLAVLALFAALALGVAVLSTRRAPRP
jgi:daunorubicin resistance ABC transporter membrane protein